MSVILRGAVLLCVGFLFTAIVNPVPASAACGATCTDSSQEGAEPQPGTTWHCCAVVAGVATSYWLVPPAATPGAACDGRYNPEVPCPDNMWYYDSFGCVLAGVGENKRCDATSFTRGRKDAVGNCSQSGGVPICVPAILPGQQWFQVTKYRCANC